MRRQAVLAATARGPQRLHSDPLADGEPRHVRADLDDPADNLVTGDDREGCRACPGGGPLSFDHVQLRMAHPASVHTDDDLAGTGRGVGTLTKIER